PGGTLGRKLLKRVEDIMIPKGQIGTGLEQDSVKLLSERMSRSNLGLVAILSASGKIVGVVTDGDLRRAYQKGDLANLTAKQVMNTKPKSIQKGRLMTEAVRLAEEYRITALMVTNENGDFEGAVNLHDLIREKVV
ncbi:MAG TPA: CBS domain-containing protein, partial [Oligoflexia bacterium]|nr:CBS domain-containing protein [Oligoflexia bacterium]